jgi:hypothetical protein
MKLEFFRFINRKRLNAENSDEFFEFFRKFIHAKNEWDIVSSDIYNINESGSAIGIRQNSKITLFNKKKQVFAK